jgi:hypothetical protein
MAIDWCMNCRIWMRKNFRLFFGKGPPYSEKRAKFLFHPDTTIHTPIDSHCRVKWKYVAFKFF